LFSIQVICANVFRRPPTPSGVDEVHLLLAAPFRIRKRCIVNVANFFKEAVAACVFVGDVKPIGPAVIAVPGEAVLGAWRVLVGGRACSTVIVLVVVVVVFGPVGFWSGPELFDEGRLLLELLVFRFGWSTVGGAALLAWAAARRTPILLIRSGSVAIWVWVLLIMATKLATSVWVFATSAWIIALLAIPAALRVSWLLMYFV
jgi:hypothetical protein